MEKKEIKIKIEGKEWEKALDDAFNEERKKIKVDGFRQGKVPKSIFIKKYGIESLFNKAYELCIEDAYNKMIEKAKDIEIAAQPEVDVTDICKDYVEYTFYLTLKPEVKLGKYKNLGIEKEEVIVTQKDIDDEIKKLQEQFKEIVIKDGAIESGDIAIIDFEGFKDGVAFEGGKGENYSLTIGSNTFIPGFEDQLIGLKAQDEKDIELSFPKDYHVEELKGQPVIFKVKVEEVKTAQLPELDKDFFEDLGYDGVESKEDLEKKVKEDIELFKMDEAEKHFIDNILKEITENSEVEIPDNMVKEEQNYMLEDFKKFLSGQGVTFDFYCKLYQTSLKEWMDQNKEQALRRIKSRLVVEAIIDKEKIDVTDEEVDNYVDELAKKYKITKEEFLDAHDKEHIKYDLKFRKALDIIGK